MNTISNFERQIYISLKLFTASIYFLITAITLYPSFYTIMAILISVCFISLWLYLIPMKKNNNFKFDFTTIIYILFIIFNSILLNYENGRLKTVRFVTILFFLLVSLIEIVRKSFKHNCQKEQIYELKNL